MLFKVIAGKDIFDLNPELRAIQEFENLTSRQMLYVILAVDYKSPFRKLAPLDRKAKAAQEAGWKMEADGKRLDMNGRNLVNGKVASVERAIKKYNMLQKNEDYETLLGLSKLIADVRALNASSDKSLTELEKAIKFSKELPALMKAKKELEDVLEMREDEITDIAPAAAEGEEVELKVSILQELNDEDESNSN